MSGLLSARDMSTMPMSGLVTMRDAATTRSEHNALAPYEHRAFTREATADNPLNALSLAVGIPVYQLAKLLGLTNSRSDPGLDQMQQAYIGIGEGLRSGLLGRR